MGESNYNALVTRRRFIGLGIVGLVGLTPLGGWARTFDAYERSVSFHHLHTGERLKATYWIKGRYNPEVLKEVNHLLRDFRTGDIKSIDPRLLDTLYALRRRLGTSKPIEVVSGYRSPQTNAMLRRRSRGVAKHSMHMFGKAIDLRIPGYGTRTLARAGKQLHVGGVGYYPRAHFVHLDTGPVRAWRG